MNRFKSLLVIFLLSFSSLSLAQIVEKEYATSSSWLSITKPKPFTMNYFGIKPQTGIQISVGSSEAMLHY